MQGERMKDSMQYERLLLGCVLQDNQLLDELKVTESLFASDKNRAIWREIERKRAAGECANIVEVGIKFPEYAAYISSLTTNSFTTEAAGYYRELCEAARIRGLSRLARDIVALAGDEKTSDDILTFIDSALLRISANKTAGYRHVYEYLAETVEEIEKAYALKGALSGIPTGFQKLDDLTDGWQSEDLVIIGARPGTGKTSIALNMSTAALKAGRRVGFFSAEMSAVKIVKRLIADWGNIEHRKLRSGYMGQGEFSKITDACDEISKTSLFINDTSGITLTDLVSDARRMRRKDAIDMVFIDYLSLISNKSDKVPRHEQVAEISASMKNLALELRIPVIVLSQLTREAQGERPKLSQLRDSGALEQDSDMVILLQHCGYVDDAKTQIKLNMIVEKNRSGRVGDVPMLFVADKMRMKEVEESWEKAK
jgi:replicative DNA helicase